MAAYISLIAVFSQHLTASYKGILAGLNEADFDRWQLRLNEGLTDASVPQEAAPVVVAAPVTVPVVKPAVATPIAAAPIAAVTIPEAVPATTPNKLEPAPFTFAVAEPSDTPFDNPFDFLSVTNNEPAPTPASVPTLAESSAEAVVELSAVDESEETSEVAATEVAATDIAATEDDPIFSLEADADESSALDDEDDLSAGFEKLFG